MDFKHVGNVSGSDRDILKFMYKKGKGRVAGRAHIILLAASICLRYAPDQIAAICHSSTKTVYNVFERYRTEGLAGLFDEARSGRPVDIPENPQTEAILQKLQTQTPDQAGISLHAKWTLELIARLLKKELAIETSVRTVSNWLHGHGWTYHRAKKELLPPGPLSPEDQKQVVDLLQCAQLTDDVLVFMDEAGFYLDGIVAGCWMPRGQQKKIPTGGRRKKVWVFGAFNPHTQQVHHRLAERCNEEGVILFLQDLLQVYPNGRIHIVLDNASFHKKSRKVKNFVAAYPRLRLHFLPARAPKLNPIERVWLYAKSVVVACAVYANLAELEKQINRFFQHFNDHQLEYNFDRQKVIALWKKWPTQIPPTNK